MDSDHPRPHSRHSLSGATNAVPSSFDVWSPEESIRHTSGSAVTAEGAISVRAGYMGRILFRGYHATSDFIEIIDNRINVYTTSIIYAIATLSIVLAFIPLYSPRLGENEAFQSTNLYSAIYSDSYGVVAVASVAVTLSGFVDCALDILSGVANETGTRERFILLMCLVVPNAFAVICNHFPILEDAAVQAFAILLVLNKILYLAPCCVLAMKNNHFGSPFLIINMFSMHVASNLLQINFMIAPSAAVVLSTNILLYVPSAGVLLLSLIFWYRLYIQWRRGEPFSSSAITVGMITACFILLAVCQQLLNVAYRANYLLDYSSTQLSLRQLFQIFFTIAVTVLPGRLSQILLLKSVTQLDMKSLFVRYVSHEIRTPLNIAVVGLDVLQRTTKSRQWIKSHQGGMAHGMVMDWDELSGRSKINEATEAEEELIEQIKDSCKVAVTILDDLLAYEKLDSGILALDKSEVYVARFIRDTAALFNIQVRGKDQLFTVLQNPDCFDEVLTCEMDPGKIAQVLRNFISNAIKFTPEGGSIQVNAFIRVESASPMLVVHVIDSGAGMDPEQLGRIFKEIIQFNANALQSGGGSGLGLWVSKKIVDLHKGCVSVSSKGAGQGCVFELALPLRSARISRGRIGIEGSDAANGNVVVLPTATQGAAMDSVSLAGLHCLVVDDSKIGRKMMMRLLDTCEMTSREAEDGCVCIQVVRDTLLEGGDRSFDVIFMDNNMPNMTGAEATHVLREMGYTGIIVGVTGDAQPVFTEMFMSVGADEVFVKPVDAKYMEMRLRAILTRDRAV